jgi:hypothetical protein
MQEKMVNKPTNHIIVDFISIVTIPHHAAFLLLGGGFVLWNSDIVLAVWEK